MQHNKRHFVYYLLAIAAFLLLVWVSLFTGVKDIAIGELFQDNEKLFVFVISRIPRTLALVLTGAGLSVAGFVMQQLSQNKFVSPTTTGALSAAKMGVLFAMIFIPGAPLLSKMIFATVFTFLSSTVFMLFVGQIRERSAIIIPLVGIMFGNIIEAVSTFFAYKNNIVQSTQEWLLGDFSSVMQGQYEAIYLILPVVLFIYFYAERFTIAGMGDSFARNLGLSYAVIVNIGLLLIALVVSASVVTVGAIPFLGLVIPNIISLLAGDNLRRTLPYTAFFGAAFLLVCDILGRILIFPYEIPIGMMVGIIGGIIFLVLIIKKNR